MPIRRGSASWSEDHGVGGIPGDGDVVAGRERGRGLGAGFGLDEKSGSRSGKLILDCFPGEGDFSDQGRKDVGVGFGVGWDGRETHAMRADHRGNAGTDGQRAGDANDCFADGERRARLRARTDGRLQAVGATDEAGDEGRRGMFVNLNG